MSESHLPELPGLDKCKCTSVFNCLSPSSYRNQAARVLWSEEDLSGKTFAFLRLPQTLESGMVFLLCWKCRNAFRWDIICLP